MKTFRGIFMIFLWLSRVVMAAFCDKKYVSRRRHVYILRSIFAQPVSYITNRKLFLEKSFSERYLSLFSTCMVRHWLLFTDTGFSSKRSSSNSFSTSRIQTSRIQTIHYTPFFFFFFYLFYNLFMRARFLILVFFCRLQRSRIKYKTRLTTSFVIHEFSRGRNTRSSPRIIFLLPPLPSVYQLHRLATDISSGVFQATHSCACIHAHTVTKAWWKGNLVDCCNAEELSCSSWVL